MSEFTTEQVKYCATDGYRGIEEDEFDAWLQSVKAKAWAEGFDAGEKDVWQHEHAEDGWDADCIKNPYLEGEQK